MICLQVLQKSFQLVVPAIFNAVTSVNTYTGDVVLVKADIGLGNADISANGSVTIVSPSIILKNAGAAIKRLVTETFISLFNSHTHTGDSGGTTSAPNQTMTLPM